MDADYTVKGMEGRVVYEDAVMIWHHDANGDVCRFAAHRLDTHQAWLAFNAA